ncbi:hypothetical protein L1887_60513 [Cichorium endivia]|nr:hypothetical protein L1887_60513 [Cichorium endivia]
MRSGSSPRLRRSGPLPLLSHSSIGVFLFRLRARRCASQTKKKEKGTKLARCSARRNSKASHAVALEPVGQPDCRISVRVRSKRGHAELSRARHLPASPGQGDQMQASLHTAPILSRRRTSTHSNFFAPRAAQTTGGEKKDSTGHSHIGSSARPRALCNTVR